LESTKQEVRSCNTCLHQPKQASSIDEAPAKCWDCTSFKTLVHWEPKKKPVEVQEDEPLELSPIDYASLHDAEEETSALETQIAGSHYKHLKIQPMEYSMANKLDACQHTAIKYITRFRSKNGLEDLEKAKHAIDLLIQFEYGTSS
jgi:hypothetical protein